jgi:hypothetical protein
MDVRRLNSTGVSSSVQRRIAAMSGLAALLLMAG